MEHNVLREQMYCIEGSTCGIVGIFRRTGHFDPFPLLVTTLDKSFFVSGRSNMRGRSSDMCVS